MTALQKLEYTIDGPSGKPIVFDVTHPAGTSNAVVVFCHGFKGFKDWGHFNLVAAEFASQGLTFVKLNFSHNGTTTESPMDFVDLEAFANNNFSKELNDLGAMLDWAKVHLPDSNQEIYLMGHSRGGGVAILKASEDARIKKLVTWSAINDIESRFPKDLDRFKKEGVVFIPNARTKQNMPLNYQFVEDYYKHEKRLNIPARLPRITIPYLIIHGSADEAVSPESADLIHKECASSELQYVDGAGHTFGAKHPIEAEEIPKSALDVVQLSIDFFRRDH